MTKTFFDTNIFVYSRLELSDPKSKRAALSIADADWAVASTQVLIEFVSVSRRKGLNFPMIAEELSFIRGAVDVVLTDPPCIERALDLMQVTKLSWFDSLIVAAAVQAECETLVTKDLNDGQVISGVRIVNPFQ